MDSRAKRIRLLIVSVLGILFLVAAVLGGSFVFLTVKNSGREPIKIRRVVPIADFETAHAQTVSTRIVVVDGDESNLVFLLEGHFKKSFGDPLLVSQTGRNVSVKIDEAQEGSHRAELTILVPPNFAKKLEIESVAGRIDASVSVEAAKHISMSTVSGATSLTTH